MLPVLKHKAWPLHTLLNCFGWISSCRKQCIHVHVKTSMPDPDHSRVHHVHLFCTKIFMKYELTEWNKSHIEPEACWVNKYSALLIPATWCRCSTVKPAGINTSCSVFSGCSGPRFASSAADTTRACVRVCGSGTDWLLINQSVH